MNEDDSMCRYGDPNSILLCVINRSGKINRLKFKFGPRFMKNTFLYNRFDTLFVQGYEYLFEVSEL